jgi:hypothetical protein
MLVIDGNYNNDDGSSNKLRKDSVEDCWKE